MIERQQTDPTRQDDVRLKLFQRTLGDSQKLNEGAARVAPMTFGDVRGNRG